LQNGDLLTGSVKGGEFLESTGTLHVSTYVCYLSMCVCYVNLTLQYISLTCRGVKFMFATMLSKAVFLNRRVPVPGPRLIEKRI
jgi:hypothetical protein